MSDVLALNARLDLPAAQPLHGALAAHISSDLTLDASEVTHMGALCVQSLIAASETIRASGHTFKLINVSERVEGQLAAMGLTPTQIEEGFS